MHDVTIISNTELTKLKEYKGWYEEAMCASNAAGFVGVSAASVIGELGRELSALKKLQATVLDDKHVAEAVNNLTNIAREFQAFQSLRLRISGVVVGLAQGLRRDNDRLKTEFAELMPLAKYGACAIRILMFKEFGVLKFPEFGDKEIDELAESLFMDDNVNPETEAAIAKVLKVQL